MEATPVNPSLGNQFAQVAWVVRDIQAAETFFRNTLGLSAFVRLENQRAEDLNGMYYGQPGDFVFHLSLAYSGDTMLELIQPVSGQSTFQDFLEKHPEGGIQHIAYAVPEADLDKAAAELTSKGFSVIQSMSLPTAKVLFFDTKKDIGVDTELIGVTEAGAAFAQQLKSGNV
ncbi:hypothetical protein GCM10023189_20570 [Nibrella saemangeumensis]|uniref:VOC domain-containing protein n=1 Tax=Nibrella saemangeumensis TaxID=1084526 RepID=A0ABP8MU49_9BACT